MFYIDRILILTIIKYHTRKFSCYRKIKKCRRIFNEGVYIESRVIFLSDFFKLGSIRKEMVFTKYLSELWIKGKRCFSQATVCALKYSFGGKEKDKCKIAIEFGVSSLN